MMTKHFIMMASVEARRATFTLLEGRVLKAELEALYLLARLQMPLKEGAGSQQEDIANGRGLHRFFSGCERFLQQGNLIFDKTW